MISNGNSILIKKANSEASDLKEIKDIILPKELKDNRKNMQNNFEKYLNKNVLNQDRKYYSKLFYDSNNVIFTNGTSVYVIKSGFLNVNEYKLKQFNKTRRYKLINYDSANTYLGYAEMRYGENDAYCLLFRGQNEVEAQYSYLHEIYDGCYFSEDEIDMCTAILNEPLYKISAENPILKAESDIGKAYILGMKKYKK